MTKKLFYFLCCFFMLNTHAMALELKIGVLAPEGTNWANNMREMANKIKEETDGAVTLRIYFGGAQGDEPDVLRKIRIGQLQGGVFTGKTLGDINGDVRVLEIPFTFEGNREKAWNAVEALSGQLNQGFTERGFVNLGFFELGMVYFVSQKENPNLRSLQGLKIWQWEGDQLVSAMIDTMGLVSVPLPLPDVLSSLSTGIIEAAYGPPLGILSLQWNTRVNYLVDFPIAYSVGAMLIDQRSWRRISEENREKILRISNEYIAKVNEANIQDNKDALTAMKSSGVKFLSFPEGDIEHGHTYREKMIKKLRGKLFSKEIYQALNSHLETKSE